MTTLRLHTAGPRQGHDGEVFSCAYTADGAFLLTAGWDGHLRLWEASRGTPVTALQADHKALSACTVSPDGSSWLSGSMEGLLTFWDAVTHQPRLSFVAHLRPISAICFSPDGQLLATSSWDRQVILRRARREQEGINLAGHHDLVAGCRFSADGRRLLSWSHEGSLFLWDTEMAAPLASFQGHADRATAASLSPDGHWAVSGSRDGSLKLWDLDQRREAHAVRLPAEVRVCAILPDSAAVLTAGANGSLLLLSLPEFEVQAEIKTSVKVLCGELAPSGYQLALGGEDGLPHFVTIEDDADAPLPVIVTRRTNASPSVLDRLLRKSRGRDTFHYTCPACRQPADVTSLPSSPFPCVHCQRLLRRTNKSRQLQPG
jgi:WD40 repeat protein